MHRVGARRDRFARVDTSPAINGNRRCDTSLILVFVFELD